VISTETFFYLEMWKQRYDWGSGAGSDRPVRNRVSP